MAELPVDCHVCQFRTESHAANGRSSVRFCYARPIVLWKPPRFGDRNSIGMKRANSEIAADGTSNLARCKTNLQKKTRGPDTFRALESAKSAEQLNSF
jgi:hypothetical protein